MGRGFAYSLYLINGVLGMLLLLDAMGVHRWIAWVYLAVHLLLCMMLKRRTGRAINPLLGMTAVAMLAVALAWLVSEICSKECNHECARKQQIGHKCCHNRYPVGVSCSRDGDVARASAQGDYSHLN